VKTYLEISISGNKSQQELLIPTMVELGCHGFIDTDTALLCYIDKYIWSDKKYFDMQKEIKNILRTISSNAEIRIKEIQEENWNKQWESTIQPIEIGQKFVIKPSWAEYHNPDNRIIIQIDPKMSFGTGYHETTRLTIKLLEKYVKNDDVILDVGTGTGILAIASVKLGAQFALGIDNDAWAISNAEENVTANNLEEFIKITDKPIPELSVKNFDLITANITLQTILEMLPEMTGALKVNGIIIFSGLLIQDDARIRNAIANNGLQFLESISEGEWIATASKLKSTKVKS
jgi:ribosomal protein L11 methyltransferase